MFVARRTSSCWIKALMISLITKQYNAVRGTPKMQYNAVRSVEASRWTIKLLEPCIVSCCCCPQQ